MNINDLEKQINFILSNYNINKAYYPYQIENYNHKENVYNDIFIFWENNKKKTNIRQEFLNQKNSSLKSLESLRKIENDFIKLTSQLEAKFNHNKINSKLNKILKIITFGCVDWNQKIEKK